MKTMIKVLSMSTFVTLFMVGCNKSDDPESCPVQIELGASLTQTQIQTRAAVDNLQGFSSIGVYGAEDNIWTVTPWINNDQSTVVPISGNINFMGIYFYPPEGDVVTFYAYHPYAATGIIGDNHVIAPSAGTPPVLNFTITGQEDLMYATSVSGSKLIAPINTLNFKHVLTQLKFTAKAGTSFPSGVTVTSITFNGVNTKGRMDITNGTLSAWTNPSNTLTSNILNGGAISATSTATPVGGPIMLQPGFASFNVTIVTSFGTFSNIVVNPTGGDLVFKAGKAYTIELTFTATEIDLAATITSWEDTGSGTGDVD